MNSNLNTGLKQARIPRTLNLSSKDTIMQANRTSPLPSISSSSLAFKLSARQAGPKASSNISLHQQHLALSQMNPSSDEIQQRLQILNAPTSLTNLVQLSGISLLPMSSSKPATNLKETNNSKTKSQSNLSQRFTQNPNTISISSSSVPVSNSKPTISHSLTPATPQTDQAKKIKSTYNRTNSTQHPQSIYNLANIPSVQLLSSQQSDLQGFNPTTSLQWQPNNESALNGTIKSQSFNNKSSPRNPRGTKTTPSSSSSIQKKNTARQKSTTKSSQFDTKFTGSSIDSRVNQPTGSSISKANNIQSVSQMNYDDLFAEQLRESEPIVIEGPVDSTDDMNNSTLLKFMAILNNPALTIIPVNSHTSSRYDDTSSNNNVTDTKQSKPAPNAPDLGLGFITKTQTEDTLSINQRNMTNLSNQKLREVMESPFKNRLPQSATNLQFMNKNDGAISTTSLDNTNPRNKDFFVHSQSIPRQNLESFRPNWLNIATGEREKVSDSDKHTATLTWLEAGPQHGGPNFDCAENLIHSDDTSIMYSTSVRNLIMQQPAASRSSTVSVQLLKHIADQVKDNNMWEPSLDSKSILEPECIIRVPNPLPDLVESVKIVEPVKIVTRANSYPKLPKRSISTSQDRLYIQAEDRLPPQKRQKTQPEQDDLENYLDDIKIETCGERLIHLSERHFMIESMMSNRDTKKTLMHEPDDIFIDRSKRVMSKIDSMIERKKKRRFERISGRNSPKNKSLEDQCADSEAEWSCDENMDLDSIKVISTQIPLPEEDTQEKRNHLISVGLVSRSQKNVILLEQSKQKAQLFSSLVDRDLSEPSEDMKNFVKAILKTGGSDVQLRIESNIKRNDLPLIEGLNRNTSRIKMNYMSALGLDKRSKRTTLYKVKSSEPAVPVQPSKVVEQIEVTVKPEQSIDLDKHFEAAKMDLFKKLTLDLPLALRQSTPKVTPINCRDSMPNKNDYMKSLGLMAS